MSSFQRDPFWVEFEEVERTRKFNKETAKILKPLSDYLDNFEVDLDDYMKIMGHLHNTINGLREDLLRLIDSTEKTRLAKELIEKWNLKP